ncbi:hypothetical protein CCP3SC1_1000013 [Gammaproteobacteria bacterium]
MTTVDVPTDKVNVEEPAPGAGIEVGLKVAVVPEGKPAVTESATAELKPPTNAVLITAVPEPPFATVIAVGEDGVAVIVKSMLITVNVIVTVCVLPPPVPVTVTVELPVAVDEPTANVNVEEPEPVAIEVGLKLAVVPEGNPEAVSAIDELKPPDGVTVMVAVPDTPFATVSVLDEVVIAKSPPVTVNVILLVFVLPPPLAVTVTV